MAVGKDALVTMFKLLKAEHPEILSILVTEAPDAELAIELINQAQVFRLLGKPLNPRSLRGYVDMALRKYAAFKGAPGLVRQHRVRENTQVQTSDWGARLFERIRALPTRLFSRSA
jgi:serine/threonine-protein kinase